MDKEGPKFVSVVVCGTPSKAWITVTPAVDVLMLALAVAIDQPKGDYIEHVKGRHALMMAKDSDPTHVMLKICTIGDSLNYKIVSAVPNNDPSSSTQGYSIVLQKRSSKK
jgi:hypothetical protein